MKKGLYGNYDELVVRCLPEYYFLLEIIVQAIGNPKRIIDLGCGTGNLARLIFKSIPNVLIEGVDTSSELLSIASNKCRKYNFLPVLADVLTLDLGQSRECIVSSFTIHHFDNCEKNKLFKNIYQALMPGEIFVNLDMVRPNNYRQTVANFLAKMKENGLSAEFIEAEKKEMAERDCPVELSTQKEWFKQIGFQFELLEDIGLFAVYRCRKPFQKGGSEYEEVTAN